MPIEPKSGDCHAYLSTILLDSILADLNNKHYLQIFLKKCVYAVDVYMHYEVNILKNPMINNKYNFLACKTRC